MRGSTWNVRTHLPKRGKVVQNPERPTVGRRNQVAFLYGEIVNGNDRQVASKRLPVGAVVERHPDSPFRSRVKESGALGILAQHASELGHGNSVRDRRPGSAIVV